MLQELLWQVASGEIDIVDRISWLSSIKEWRCHGGGEV